MDSELMACRAALAERDKTIAELREAFKQERAQRTAEGLARAQTIAGLVAVIAAYHETLKNVDVEDWAALWAIRDAPEVKAALEGK